MRSSRARCPLVLLALLWTATTVSACPFCKAVRPTLAQQQDQAQLAVLVESLASDGASPRFRIQQVLKSSLPLKVGSTLAVSPDPAVAPGALALLTGGGDATTALNNLLWTAVSLDEAGFAYVARAPNLRKPANERLVYFARFLEHPQTLLAEDAFLEFGHAPYDEVAAMADRLSMAKLRMWLIDPQVPPERKGFYAMALGLAKSPEDRRINRDLLWRQIATPESDFRAGFDGMLAGYLLLTGRDGLRRIADRYFTDPHAAIGDVHHALSAWRFYHEFGPKEFRDDLAVALEPLLGRPEFAADVIADLARWQHWTVLYRIADLYAQPTYSQPAMRRAIVGYLRACPLPQAAERLTQLRRTDPAGIAAAEQALQRP